MTLNVWHSIEQCSAQSTHLLTIVMHHSKHAYVTKSRFLRWFGHVERKDDNDWVKRCITREAEGIRQRTPEKDLVGLC